MAEDKSIARLTRRIEALDQKIKVIKQRERKARRQQRALLYRQVGQLVVSRTGIESVAELSKYKFVNDHDDSSVTMAPSEQEGVTEYDTIVVIKAYLARCGIDYRHAHNKTQLLALVPKKEG